MGKIVSNQLLVMRDINIVEHVEVMPIDKSALLLCAESLCWALLTMCVCQVVPCPVQRNIRLHCMTYT